MNYYDLCETVPDEYLPRVDKIRLQYSSHRAYADWNRAGYTILKNFIPHELIDAYCSVRERIADPHGYPTPTPYLKVPEILDLCCYKPLSEEMERLIEEPVGLHLNLSGWVSSNRGWHADTYLSPSHVGGFYIAAWFVLDDVHPNSGPFEYIPGSHQPQNQKLSLAKCHAELRRRGIKITNDWAKQTEEFLSPLVEQEIAKHHWESKKFLGKKGDVLLWHSNLIHRGSEARIPGTLRKSLIAHYTGINHKHSSQWPNAVQHKSGGWFFPF